MGDMGINHNKYWIEKINEYIESSDSTTYIMDCTLYQIGQYEGEMLIKTLAVNILEWFLTESYENKDMWDLDLRTKDSFDIFKAVAKKWIIIAGGNDGILQVV